MRTIDKTKEKIVIDEVNRQMGIIWDDSDIKPTASLAAVSGISSFLKSILKIIH